MEDKNDFLEKLLEHFEKCVKESLDNPSTAKKWERNIIFGYMYEDQQWLDYTFDNMTEEEHAHWRKLLSTEVTTDIGIQTEKNLEEFYGKDVSKSSLVLGSSSNGQVYNPLKQLLINTELLLIKENISANLSNELLYNPYTLYKGLLGSLTEINILETEHFKIVGNNLLELKIHKMSEGDFSREKEILLEVTKNLQDILLIQAELN